MTFRSCHGRSRGRALPNVLSLEDGEDIQTCIPVREFSDDQYLVMATAKGQVKKTVLSAYGRPRAGGIKAVKLAEGDRLVHTMISDGKHEIMLASQQGQAIRFRETDIRATGRDTGGVTGINLAEHDQVVSMLLREPDTDVLTICANGSGKRTEF